MDWRKKMYKIVKNGEYIEHLETKDKYEVYELLN